MTTYDKATPEGWRAKALELSELAAWTTTMNEVEIAAEKIASALARAVAEERRRIASWYQEAFCPSHGVKADERHARGDCDSCNIAAAICKGQR